MSRLLIAPEQSESGQQYGKRSHPTVPELRDKHWHRRATTQAHDLDTEAPSLLVPTSSILSY